MKAKFELGDLVMTRAIYDTYKDDHDFTYFLVRIINRHLNGDWGDLDEEDKAANDEALIEPYDRILSSYSFRGEKIWIITEWDRSVTTVLFPSDY